MRRLAPILFSLLLLFGLGVASAQHLTMAAAAQPDTLDPQATAATSAFAITKSLYDTLAEMNQQGEIVPSLASSWDISPDGLTYTFHLVKATFSDGTAFDSQDVKASIERIQSKALASPKRGEFEPIAHIATPDPRTVVLTLSKPDPALLATLASGWGAILPSQAIAAGHDFANHPDGTGPFRLGTWVRDSSITLIRNPDYFKGAPPLAQVTVRFVKDAAVQLQGLISGQFDVIDTVAAADEPTVTKNPALRLVKKPSGEVLVASINNRRPYLSDPRVRRALNLAIDKQTILNVAYGGGTPVGTFMEVGSPWLPASIKPFPYDPEQAKALLQQAGVPKNWTLNLVLPQPYPQHIKAGQMLQAMLRQVGVNTKIKVVEWGVWLSTVYEGAHDFDLTVIGHTGKLDPSLRLSGYGDPKTNYIGYDNPTVVKELAEAASATDPATRKALYAKVLQAMHDDAPFIYFGTPFTTYAERKSVSGFWITPLLDTFDFRTATVK
jgi:peptide/nickel transport system substrate-binding protein